MYIYIYTVNIYIYILWSYAHQKQNIQKCFDANQLLFGDTHSCPLRQHPLLGSGFNSWMKLDKWLHFLWKTTNMMYAIYTILSCNYVGFSKPMLQFEKHCICNMLETSGTPEFSKKPFIFLMLVSHGAPYLSLTLH